MTASSAMYISLGSNIGSCCTALLSSLGESRNAKRSAVIHLTFNVLGALVWGSGLFVLFQFRPAFGTMGIDSVGISVFHTIFNLVCTVLMTPLRENWLHYPVFWSKAAMNRNRQSRATMRSHCVIWMTVSWRHRLLLLRMRFWKLYTWGTLQTKIWNVLLKPL